METRKACSSYHTRIAEIVGVCFDKSVLIRYFLLILALLTLNLLNAQGTPDSVYIKENYVKEEFKIPMRDGLTLFTAVYTPVDTTKKYPILMHRTCYDIAPYGEDSYPKKLGPNPYLMREGYVFVYQDVRGRYMSEGKWTNMTPNIPGNDLSDKHEVDESSDTWDTIDWLLKKTDDHNGRVGIWGVSYPGFYAAASLPDAHPALRAVSPQAPIADFFFDDFHHHGAFIQAYLPAYPVFGYQKEEKTTVDWYREHLLPRKEIEDGYAFNLELGPLHNVDSFYGEDNFFWQQTVEHPNYDTFWQKRDILPHLRDIQAAVLTVGGWFDAEDLYGPLNIYKSIEFYNRNINTIVMGPWSHGDWHREKGHQMINHIFFGDTISTFFMQEIETPFFEYHLKGKGDLKLPEAYLFDTGSKEWKKFDSWPTEKLPSYTLNFAEEGKLSLGGKKDSSQVFTYISDPDHPVPYTSEIEPLTFTPRRFMTDDQRYASRRPDVLTFETEELTKDVLFGGEIMAKLQVAMTGSDADFVVKLIDVHPGDYKEKVELPEHVVMQGYQMLVRSEVFRGRFRNSYEQPSPFTPGEKTAVEFKLQDVLHTFKKGHRIMIQIHSTWFPYMDRNPQKYVPNIYKAKADDFIKADISIYGDSEIVVNPMGQ